MSDYLIAVFYAVLLFGGLAAPFVTSLGYVWVDSFYPQYVGRFVLGGFPVAQVMGIGALLSYVLLDRRAPPRVGAIPVLIGCMAIWMTLSLTWSVRPDSAYLKWDWAFKAVMFAGFIPFVFRTRVQIEALIQVHILGSAMHILGVGIKSFLTGGGYQMNLTLLPAELGLSESSAMATVAITFVPLLLYLRKHAILVPWNMVRNVFYASFALFCVTAAVGTGARTGIVCMAALAGLYWMQSRKKLVSAMALGILGILMLVFSPDKWKTRMATIDDYNQESSAMTRLRVWQWILDYVRDNPLGGGFRVYEINVIQMPADALNPDGWVQRSRAPHSTWFEMLSELGWPGLILFLVIIAVTFATLVRVMRRTRGIENLAWCNDLARALVMALLVLMAGSTFIGIGFQPWYWILFATSFCLSEYVRRAFAADKPRPAYLPAVPAPPSPGMRPMPEMAARGMGARRRA
jgi:putative inorganic carbon (hco3(-)) transporter